MGYRSLTRADRTTKRAMTGTASNDSASRVTPRERTDTEDPSRVAEDGTVERTHAPSEEVHRSGTEWHRRGESFREWTERPDRLQLLLGALFGTSVLGATAGVVGIVPPATLASAGVPVLFLTVLVLAVVLLREAATDEDSPSDSWAREGRPPVKRRP
jgi:hypothetical protein